ncbi:hypothetical protein [Rothia sp. LK2492]|uniref:hypothetical protein n=1 Tax=Rothia sp. LK2492 TaxID=3114370 RepID=UPI0034CE6563
MIPSEFSLVEVLQKLVDTYSPIRLDNISNSVVTWDALIESIRFYPQWIKAKENVRPMSLESWMTSKMQQNIIVQASSNVESALRDCSITRLKKEFPNFEDIEEFVEKSNNSKGFKSEDHGKIKTAWSDAIKSTIPYGANPSNSRIKECLTYISSKCSEDYTSLINNTSLNPDVIKFQVDLRNSISHGNSGISFSEELLALIVWHSFEIPYALNLYASGLNRICDINGNYNLISNPFEADFIRFHTQLHFRKIIK